jgi:D-glycero-D-manno-heptose 1,7-bisphosphate phosphatase
MVFAGARDLFPTAHVLAALPGKNSLLALRQFSRRALRCGGTVPEKISNRAPHEDTIPPLGRTVLMGEDKRQAAVFLDRDGTINEEVGYLDRLEKLCLIPGAAEAIRLINESGMKAVVVTNQSGVARGIFDEAFLDEVHARLREMLREARASLDGFYFCPHHPTEGRGRYLRSCGCRKPAPGLLLRAADELSLDPERSYMIGDTLKDIEAASRIGARGILVRTGYGAEAADALGPAAEPRRMSPGAEEPPHGGDLIIRPVHIAEDLLAAVRWLLEDRKT